ncbi:MULTISPECIES: type II toxin-antitoxin system RelE family toxin [Deferribacter]|uniref:Type II toxin-antitoxin system mRNA interferase toxin, RelE/StbE family n=1 Tax=Deferribacter autotrophicus TaxID=500465 RepID=A0A5A8F137_9BACT|nr:type II toxin-antitoxin system mRNA interferase toxin, RelE/StbE family [Deferribacter autotrophicus]KAA0257620.1 type II toxin-antitoxin system mRNA interferase toxin, RelE/StbE family [Deferribacter autotrophicus]
MSKKLKVKYSEIAVKDLKNFNVAERQLIVKKIHYLADNFEELKKTKKITELKGTKYKGQYRFIIARKIRAIFRIENEELILLVLRIGKRKDVYK